MRTNVISVLFTVAVLCGGTRTFGQGSLTPSAGPGATMKSLDDIYRQQALSDPRTAITNLPYTISQGGSYYLPANLTAAASHGITIVTGGVVLDMMGYTLAGSSSYYAILFAGTVGSPLTNIVVRNGAISGWGRGMDAKYVSGCRFTDLNFSANSYSIFLDASNNGMCSANTISGCNFLGGSYGIEMNAYSGGAMDGNLVENCRIMGYDTRGINMEATTGGRLTWNVVRNTTIGNNKNGGFYVYINNGGVFSGNQIVNCAIVSNVTYGLNFSCSYTGRCSENVIQKCTIAGNSSSGVYVDSTYSGTNSGNRFADCAFGRNGYYGIVLNGYTGGFVGGTSIERCIVSGNANTGIMLSGVNGRCNDNVISECTVSQNGGYGIDLDGTSSGECNGNAILNCTASANANNGIYILGGGGNRVRQCVCRGNNNYGVALRTSAVGNWVEENQCYGQTGAGACGIYSDSTCSNNLVVRNVCMGQANNFYICTNDTSGPIVNSAGTLSTTGAAASAWANFAR